MILSSRLLTSVFLVLLLICALFQSTTAGETTQITLAWAPGDTKEGQEIVKYGVYSIKTGETKWKKIGEVEVPDTTFPDYPVNYGKTYSFFVTSIDSNEWESYPSNMVTWPIEVFALKEEGIETYSVYPGTTHTIEWYAAPKAEKLRLLYSTNNGASWKVIKDGVTGRSYEWTVPLLPGDKTRCLIRVIGFDSKGVKVGYANSDLPFAIEVVKLMTPNGGEALTSGDPNPQTIAWQTHATNNRVLLVSLRSVDWLRWVRIKDGRLGNSTVRLDSWLPAGSSTVASVWDS